jgi:hypothetical protein
VYGFQFLSFFPSFFPCDVFNNLVSKSDCTVAICIVINQESKCNVAVVT